MWLPQLELELQRQASCQQWRKDLEFIVLNVGGMEMKRPAGSGPAPLLPRIKQPRLMLSVKPDMFFPVGASENPCLQLHQSTKAPEDKKSGIMLNQDI